MKDVWNAAGFRAMRAAQKLGVFEALPGASGALAQRLQCDERGIRLLLETLETFGYVNRTDDRYSASELATDLRAPLDFWGTIVFELWADLERSVREGKPPLDFYQWLEQHPAELGKFQSMLRAIARELAKEVVERVEIPAAPRRLIDIGGGHGEYSAAFTQKRNDLTATVFDFPGALENAVKSDRIALQPGNFLQDDFGTGYDIALLMSVVHGHVADVNVDLLRRVKTALNPGGQIVILEQLAKPDPFNRVFSLNLFHLQGGQTYSFEEIRGWLIAAGFRKPRKIKLRTSPGDALIVATAPPMTAATGTQS